MKIIGLPEMSLKKLNRQLKNGARFVYYNYTISIIFMTFKNNSGVYFIPAEKSGFVQGLPYSFVSILFGWWGIPWGPIYTIESIINNFEGGFDVTDEVRDYLREMVRYE